MDTYGPTKSRSGACWTGPLKGFFSTLSTTTFGGQNGEKSRLTQTPEEVLRSVVSHAPKLIPLIGHRYLPEEPHEGGNPVFSVYQSDVIYYGANLADYFEREFTGGDYRPRLDQMKHIRCRTRSDKIVQNRLRHARHGSKLWFRSSEGFWCLGTGPVGLCGCFERPRRQRARPNFPRPQGSSRHIEFDLRPVGQAIDLLRQRAGERDQLPALELPCTRLDQIIVPEKALAYVYRGALRALRESLLSDKASSDL